MNKPETQYARSGDVNIAYQVIGDGPIDLVHAIGWISNIDVVWEEPSYARFLERLASFTRLVIFDKRGTGLSDRVSIKELPSMEQRMDDVRAIMDTIGSRRAALMGISEGGPLCMLMAATYPERVSALITVGSYAVGRRTAAVPGARSDEEWDRLCNYMEDHWGHDAAIATIRDRAPSVYKNADFLAWWERYLRLSGSPGAVVALTRMNQLLDVRAALPAITAPTLIMHASRDQAIGADNRPYLAAHIRGSRYIEFEGDDHLSWVNEKNTEIVIGAIQELLTGKQPVQEAKRILVTVLYTDVVRSTEQGAELGDEKWRDVIESHLAIAREEVDRYDGRFLKWLGDGVLATFDGPARAIRAAAALRDRLAGMGVETRAGLHTGECEIIGDDLGGIAMSIGARVSSLANAGEILVSSTVKDLVASSGIEFADHGAHALKGVPGEWRIFAVQSV
jgi:class 3 adenylate cyclase